VDYNENMLMEIAHEVTDLLETLLHHKLKILFSL
ncbi:uncharacterized protein METZ01_LOCUS279318, partial [marine metagenome]